MNKCQIFYDIFSKHYDFVGRSHGFKLNTDERKRTRMTLITRILKGHTDNTDHTDLKLFFSDFVIDFGSPVKPRVCLQTVIEDKNNKNTICER